MSGKPGCVRAAAPRLLVYVEPRQLEPGAPPHCRPPQPLYAHSHHAARTTQLFYKPLENDNKLALFGTHENINHKPEFYQVPQQFSKDSGLKIEDSGPDRPTGIHIKQDSADKIRGEFCGVDTFQCSTAAEPAELAAYQARCSGASVNSMPVQQITFRQGQNQYSESVTVHSADISSEKESVDKSYVNYQFLEQSVSHQSIVNQSISILNQQVGVSGGTVSEGENSPQLVRTAEGVVLAVVPGPTVPSVDTPPLTENPPLVTSDSPQTITVPLGWRRIVTGTSVLYISPSGTALSTLPQLREYLQTTGTCKCGLPCPLRPETAFSFDSKVVSKPYQAAVGAELTKLCNHKRKLLATLQARNHSPDTPPPPLNTEQKKAMGTEVAVLKKKMKKRPGFPANMSVSQLMVQRERPLAEFKESECGREVAGALRVPSGAPPPYTCATGAGGVGSAGAAGASDVDKQRSAHYITVNNGWITQHHPEPLKPAQHVQPPLGVPVRGANGQIIGVNTCYKQTFRPPPPDHEQKDERKDPPAPQPGKQMQNAGKEEESQIFCGLNQPLTPEVMQKINEQQQIFIQQNQKQIEMAMKGYRSQLVESANQCKPRGPAPQGQLIIQNGAVVKTNPAKTPPWQVKRSDCTPAVTSPNPQIQKLDPIEYEESTATMSEDSSSSFSSMSSSEQRVPPLPQHYPALALSCPPQDNSRKKGKPTKVGKKKNSPADNKLITFGTNGMRMLQDPRGNCSDDTAANNVPSFMDDPSGYLAQQTVLLNDTISRQVGMSSSYDGTRFDGSNGSSYLRHHQQQRAPMKPGEMTNTYRLGSLDASPSPHTTPDSSVLSDNSMLQCCRGCDAASKGDSPEYGEQMRAKYLKHGVLKPEEGGMGCGGRQAGGDSPAAAPIQAGTVTSSARAEAAPPEPSPTPSGSSCSADTPLAHAPYPSPEPYCPATGTQVMHFISNHNVNKNLMEVDNISMVGVRLGARGLPAYCPPPHLGAGGGGGGGGAGVRGATVAGGLSVTRDTVTCVLAGRAHTATTSVRAARAHRPPPPLDLAIPNAQPDPFLDAVNLPTSYPLHIAGTTAQNMISKSPLEMVQHVIGALPARSEQTTCPPVSHTPGKRTTPGQILISSTGQIIVSDDRMPPPPPKASSGVAFNQNANMSSGSSPQQGSGGQVGQPTVVVNAVPGGPYMLQQPMMAVDGQVVQAGQLVASAHSPDEPRHMDMKGQQGYVQGGAMLSPESVRRRNKKKARAAGVVQVQGGAGAVVPAQAQAQAQGAHFSPRFQLSPGGTLSPTPVLQALTIVPGKQGAPAHIVMNGQGQGFSSQQLLTGAPSSQQINLLQPVNLLNNAGGVVSNFPAFQQFLVPGLGGMVMEGAALLPDAGVQLQLSTVNGQSVLTPVGGQMFGAGGMVLRAPNKLPHSPGAHLFHQPHQQVLVSAASFPQQASPLLATLSPTLCAARPPHAAPRALVVPVSPKRARTDTFVQNTTIVRQQTTLVSGEEPTRLVLEERHSVSTQTARKSPRSGGSPPDTTTHSPLGALDADTHYARATPHLADTTTSSPEPQDNNTSAMVQCVSSSEPDMSEARELAWPGPARTPDFNTDTDAHGTMMSNMAMMRQRPHNPVESSEIHYNQQMMPQQHNQHTLPIATNYYERTQTYKRKNDFGDGSTYRSDKIMRTNSYNMVHAPKDTDYDMGMGTDKITLRYQPSGSNSDGVPTQKVFDRHHLGSSDDGGSSEGGEAKSDASSQFEAKSESSRQFEAGQVVWGPVKGYPSWPGALIGRGADGRWRVRWFGGERAPPPVSLVHARDLLTLSEGLEAHHAARTKHRKSRKLNTLLESAIQEAMAELDKKSERASEVGAEATSSEPAGAEPITETPKRTKKDKMKAKSQHKKNPVKIAPNPNKTGDGARLRSSR